MKFKFHYIDAVFPAFKTKFASCSFSNKAIKYKQKLLKKYGAKICFMLRSQMKHLCPVTSATAQEPG